jgi:hypothetical protein
MPEEKPGDHEKPESYIASDSEVEVFEDFGERQNNVGKVHEAENQGTDAVLMISVGAKDKGAGEDMVSEHLPMVLAALLNVHHRDLL